MSAAELYQKELEFAISQCWADGALHSKVLKDGIEVHAAPHKNRVEWSVKVAVKRGIRSEDGSDVPIP